MSARNITKKLRLTKYAHRTLSQSKLRIYVHVLLDLMEIDKLEIVERIHFLIFKSSH